MMNETADKPEQSRKEHRIMEQQGVKRILVYGATGAQASPVARRLLEDGLGVRALTRDPGSPRAKALHEAGAEVVGGHARRRKPGRGERGHGWGVLAGAVPA